MTQEHIDKLIDREISKMIDQEPVKMIVFMLNQMGKQCVDANAETLDMSQEANIGHDRYKIFCKIKIKKIGKATPLIKKNSV